MKLPFMNKCATFGTPLENVFERVTYVMTYCKKEAGDAHTVDLLKPHIDSYNVVFLLPINSMGSYLGSFCGVFQKIYW